LSCWTITVMYTVPAVYVTEQVKHIEIFGWNGRCRRIWCLLCEAINFVLVSVVTAMHGMQTRSSDENFVRPSVCVSVKRVDSDKTKQKSVQIFIPHERSFTLVFWEKEWLVGVTPSTWNCGSTDPRWSEIVDFEQIIARSASAVTPSEKVQLTQIGNPLRAFQLAYNDQRTLPLSPQKEGLKNAKRPFFL